MHLQSYFVPLGGYIYISGRSLPASSKPFTAMLIADCGVLTPSIVLRATLEQSLTPSGEVVLTASLASLKPGYYEIVQIQTDEPSVDSRNSGRDFARQILQVGTVVELNRDRASIEAEALKRESDIHSRFLEGMTVPGTSAPVEYRAFVLLTGVLITVPLRLEKVEVFPGGGLVDLDRLEVFNRFLADRFPNSRLSFQFPEPVRNQQRDERPACFVHFPRIQADDMEKARQYVVEYCARVANILSVYRGGEGVVSDVVVQGLQSLEANHFLGTRPYRGNLIRGTLGGESAERLNSCPSQS